MTKSIIFLAFMIVFAKEVFSINNNNFPLYNPLNELVISLVDNCQLLEEHDTTFYFTLDNSIDIINSKTGILVRRHSGSSLSTKFELTSDEIVRIKNEFLYNKLSKVPDNFRPVSAINGMPLVEYVIVVYYNGKKKKLIYNPHFESATDMNELKIIHRIKSFVECVNKIIYKKDCIEKMLPSDIDFL